MSHEEIYSDGGDQVIVGAQITEIGEGGDVAEVVVGEGGFGGLGRAAAFQEALHRLGELREGRGRHGLLGGAGQGIAGIHIFQGVGVGGFGKHPPGPVRHRLGRGQAFGVVAVVVEGLHDLTVDGGVGGYRWRGDEKKRHQE